MTVSVKRLGRTVKTMREDRGWTQGELAAAVGVERTNVIHWEHGRSYPNLPNFSRLVRLFGESMDSFMAKAAGR